MQVSGPSQSRLGFERTETIARMASHSSLLNVSFMTRRLLRRETEGRLATCSAVVALTVEARYDAWRHCSLREGRNTLAETRACWSQLAMKRLVLPVGNRRNRNGSGNGNGNIACASARHLFKSLRAQSAVVTVFNFGYETTEDLISGRGKMANERCEQRALYAPRPRGCPLLR